MKQNEKFKKHVAHVFIMQELMQAVCTKLNRRARMHDADKLEDSIGHYTNADHHIQYWIQNGGDMSFTSIMEMYFNVVAHHMQDNSTNEDFIKKMDELVEKLKDAKQFHVLPIIQALYDEFPPGMFRQVA